MIAAGGWGTLPPPCDHSGIPILPDPRAPHLWLALSPHGYGHAAMTAPAVLELRRRRPDLRLTIQTAIPRDFLAGRYGEDFTHVPDIPDFGLCMVSATGIDVAASAARYAQLHRDWPAVVTHEAARLRAARPDLVLANVPYVTIAAAAEAGVPVVALSSLNWADLYAHYVGDDAILAQMRAAYGKAAVFLRCLPAMEMSLPNLRDIGVIARRGEDRRRQLRERLGLSERPRIGLIAFGGIDHRLPLADWPHLADWQWLTTLDAPPRPDIIRWENGGLAFSDLLASVDVVVTKPGYGTFSEAGLCGTPVLFVPRPDWPESPHLDLWLARHTRCRAIPPEALFSPDLGAILDALQAQPIPPTALAEGTSQAADVLETLLEGRG